MEISLSNSDSPTSKYQNKRNPFRHECLILSFPTFSLSLYPETRYDTNVIYESTDYKRFAFIMIKFQQMR